MTFVQTQTRQLFNPGLDHQWCFVNRLGRLPDSDVSIVEGCQQQSSIGAESRIQAELLRDGLQRLQIDGHYCAIFGFAGGTDKFGSVRHEFNVMTAKAVP